jgi:hypothetical protein
LSLLSPSLLSLPLVTLLLLLSHTTNMSYGALGCSPGAVDSFFDGSSPVY